MAERKINSEMSRKLTLLINFQIIKDKKAEKNQLINLKKEKGNLIAKLTKNEKSLREEMSARKQSIKKLDNLIASLIKIELEAEKKNSSGKKELAMELTGKFEDQMRKLPWPVNTGFISLKFGLQRDLILKNEIDRIGHNLFYLSGTMMHKGQIDFDCGSTFEDLSLIHI